MGYNGIFFLSIYLKKVFCMYFFKYILFMIKIISFMINIEIKNVDRIYFFNFIISFV